MAGSVRRLLINAVLRASTSPVGPRVDKFFVRRTGHSLPTFFVSKLVGEPYRKPLVLSTTGRRSGRVHTVVLPYGPVDGDADRLGIVASNAGADHDPDWLKNLEADPDVQVTVEYRRRSATAVVTEGPERTRLWADLCARAPLYARYQEQTDRQIPVVVLELAPPGQKSESTNTARPPT